MYTSWYPLLNAPGDADRLAADDVMVRVVPVYDHVYPVVIPCDVAVVTGSIRLVEPIRKVFPLQKLFWLPSYTISIT